MKIDNSTKTVGGVSTGDAQTRPAKTEKKTPVESLTSDNVQLSTELQNLEKSLASGEVFDTARVDEIKQAIANGRFHVDTAKVADRLLEQVRELIQTKKG